MKVGDTVIHKKTNRIGVVLLFTKNKLSAIIDYSDTSGVMCRWVCVESLEVISEEGRHS